MTRKPDIAEADLELFRAHMEDVKPLADDRVAPLLNRPAPLARNGMRDEQEVLRELLSEAWDPADFDTGEELMFARPGLQHTLLRKLRRGRFRVRGELDLHGMTVPVARQAVVTFLLTCRAADTRCVRIIHGKGLGSRHRGPVLKHKVNRWLAQREEVLAFCSALPGDGGTGAVYVLLKRH